MEVLSFSFSCESRLFSGRYKRQGQHNKETSIEDDLLFRFNTSNRFLFFLSFLPSFRSPLGFLSLFMFVLQLHARDSLVAQVKRIARGNDETGVGYSNNNAVGYDAFRQRQIFTSLARHRRVSITSLLFPSGLGRTIPNIVTFPLVSNRSTYFLILRY